MKKVLFIKYLVIIFIQQEFRVSIYIVLYISNEMEIGYQMLFESERNLGSWTGNKGKKNLDFFSPNLRSVSPHLNFACYLTFVSPFLYLMYLGFHNKFTSSCKILWLFRHVLAISLASLGAENQISFRYEILLWIEVQRCFSPEPWITNIGI